MNFFGLPLFVHPLKHLERERNALKIDASWPKSLQRLVSAPLPKINTSLDTLRYLALDFETTGFEPKNDHILSIGSIEMAQSRIELCSAQHFYISTNRKIEAESAIINHIVPEMLLDAGDINSAMNRLFEMMIDKVVLVHGAIIEKRFVDYYVQQKFGLKQLPIVWLDTLAIEKHLTYIVHGEECRYQLTDVRKKHELPNYPAHNALVDSLSCAELFLAQVANIFRNQKTMVTLGEVYNKKTAPHNLNLFD